MGDLENRLIKVLKLSSSITSSDLEMKFSISGEVEDCFIAKVNEQNVGFILFTDEDGVESAKVLNGIEFMDVIV